MAEDNNLKVLNALDAAKTQWYHFTAIIIAGMGFFTDAYDLFCISLVTKMLGRIYYHVDGSAKPGSLPPNVSAAVNGVALCGTLAGQLFFGWLGDKLGRKKVYGLTLMLMCLAPLPPAFLSGVRRNPSWPLSASSGFGLASASAETTLSPPQSCPTAFEARSKAPAYEVNPIASTPPEADYVGG
ncbi:UNVERIFIED_CONTAM: putative inorganic phosphate transporter 1-7 [Sesamum calycinum]|uniref:Inorganic phosphate transporter 1-7 n=1 Tax=Sesamum calycinum TaxID=2727403 RepID=A0AAW2RUL5_9LAMI